jgi:hypothetical protein
MYCLIQFYHQVSKDIKEHRPFLKILSIKLVIFLSFWQLVSASGEILPVSARATN